MYILSNALQNLLRNKGRNLMIGAIIFAIIITTVVALTINNTAGKIIDDYKSKFGSEVTISPNMQKLLKNNPGAGITAKPATITPAQYIAFGESAYLLSSDYRAYIFCRGNDLTPIESENAPLSGARIEIDRGPLGADGFVANVKLLGNYFDEFSNGTREIYEGTLPKKEDECMISAELAKKSDLKIGDIIELEGRVVNADDSVGTLKYALTIVGIYLDGTTEFAAYMIPGTANNRRNEILANYDTVVKPIIPGQMGGIEITPTFYLKNPDMLADFSKELYAKGLDETYDVKTDEVGYQRIVGPVEGMKGISVTFMCVVLVLGAVILALLSTLAIRERKYEIGVLRAMGMKKSTVALGLWGEMLIITCICLVIGLASGRLLAQPVADVLLENQTTAYVAPQNEQLQAGLSIKDENGQEIIVDDVEFSDLNVSMDLLTVVEIVLIAFLLTSISGAIAIRKITKYEPIKILMERN